MNIVKALQNLLNDAASEEDIELLKRLLASGGISIGGNVNHSVIIIGSGNTVELPPAALDQLNARPMLGNLDRDLTSEEIASGLRRLEKLLPNRAPVLIPQFKATAARLRPTLKIEFKSLSEFARRERLEALVSINSICIEAVDVSFNGLSLGEEAPKYDTRSPFRGLESFRPEDSEFFFGREALTEKLVGKIKAHSFLAVLGASGSGKSSLVMAGVIPALASDYVIFRPGMNPLDELEAAPGKSLIVVDQFEELFTLTRDESTRKEFIAKLLDAKQKVIITLRSDFLGEVGAYRALSEEIQSHLEIIPPMNMDELRRAMEGQAGVVGLRFETDLSQQILDDVAGEPGAMPLLQHALWELWNRRHGCNLRASEYRAFGGVKQAITSTAEKVYAECSKPEQDTLRDIFLRLTRLDESDEGRDTRRRVPLEDLIPSGRDTASITLLLDKLANARLIVKTVNENKTEVEVAHEALIRHWERLRIWLNEDRDALRLRESVSESAKEWERSGRDESLLNHRGGRLDDAVSLNKDSHYGLTNIEQTYLKECVAYQKREQTRRERLRRQITIGLGIGFAVVLAVAILAVLQWRRAEQQAQIALARQLAAQGQSIYLTGSSNQMAGVLMAIQSLKILPSAEAAQVLQSNTLGQPIIKATNHLAVYSLAVSPDGKYIVSGGCDKRDNIMCIQGTVRVWETITGKEINRLSYAGSVSTVAFSPDGIYIVSGGCEKRDSNMCMQGVARVWDFAAGKEIARISYAGSVSSVAFSSDGKFVVSGGCEKFDTKQSCITSFVDMWNSLTGEIEFRKTLENEAINFVAISPNGNSVVSGSNDGFSHVWDVISGKELIDLKPNGSVFSIAISPNSEYVAVGSAGGGNTIKLWNFSSRTEISLKTNNPLDQPVESVVFSPDSKFMILGTNRAIKVFEVSTGTEIFQINNSGYIQSLAVSPNGKYILSGNYDGLAIVWDMHTGVEIARITHGSSINSVGFSNDGKYAISGSSDGIVYIWSPFFLQKITRLEHYEVISAAFSNNSKYVVTGGLDATARIWDLNSGKEISRFNFDNGVTNLTFSSDNKYLISDLDDFGFGPNSIRVTEIATRKEIARIRSDDLLVAYSPNGKLIATDVCIDEYLFCDQGNIVIWDIETGKQLFQKKHDADVNSMVFIPKNDYIASNEGSIIRIWDFTNGETKIQVIHNDLNCIMVSLDGHYMASSGGNMIKVWDTSNGKLKFEMRHNDVYCAKFSSDGKLIASNGYNNVIIWNAITGKYITNFVHEGIDSSTILFSPDGKYLLSGGSDNTARVWDAVTGIEVARIAHDNSVQIVKFSPDNKLILSASSDNTVRIGMYRPEDLIAEACSRITRNFTRAEWQQYIGDVLQYQAVCPNLPIEPEAAGTSMP